ncbi:MAG: alanine--tRNA ligase-related protein [Anaerovoracaceae bacterium]
MNTQKLYQDDVYKNECSAVVRSAGKKNGKSVFTFDKTIFFPTGGGQSCDTGVIKNTAGSELRIIDVTEENGEIIHTADGDVEGFDEGTAVEMKIDWDRRFDNMQRHCGEHIVSGAFYRLFGAVNRGFHMGSDSMVIDFELPRGKWDREALRETDEPSDVTRITWAMAIEAEREANRVIWADAPVTASRFDTREEAEKMPLRKHLAFDEDISIVTIGSLPRPFDCCPCCGTHPSSSGQVGMIKIYKIEPDKGYSRMFMEAGRRAFLRAEKNYDDLYDIALALSSGTDDASEKMRKYMEKSEETHDRLYQLKQQIFRREADDIISSMSPCLVKRWNGVTRDDLFSIAKKLDGHVDNYVFLVDDDNFQVVVCASGKDGSDAGKLVKSKAAAFSGRGGGKPSQAMVKFPSKGDMDNFLDAMQHHA